MSRNNLLLIKFLKFLATSFGKVDYIVSKTDIATGDLILFLSHLTHE